MPRANITEEQIGRNGRDDRTARRALLTDVANEIDAQGGSLELGYETHLCVATKKRGV